MGFLVMVRIGLLMVCPMVWDGIYEGDRGMVSRSNSLTIFSIPWYILCVDRIGGQVSCHIRSMGSGVLDLVLRANSVPTSECGIFL